MALAEARAKYAAGQRARAAGDIAASDKLFGEAAKLEQEANIARDRNAATLESARIQAAASGQTGKQEEAKVEAYMRDNPKATRSEAYAAVAQYARGESNDLARQKAVDAALAANPEYRLLALSKKPEDIEKIKQIKEAAYRQYGITQVGASAPTPIIPPKDIEAILKKYPSSIL
jgi:hypothetical protein